MNTQKIFLLVSAFAYGIGTMAQDTYLNDQLTNNSTALHGTARYVGMGGAMGALGADISVMSWNPAGIGMMRKNDISLSLGAAWDKHAANDFRKGKASVEQFGLVFSIPGSDDENLRALNFGVNYQLKKNYHNSFTTTGLLNGLSQMDQVCAILNAFGTGDGFEMYPSLAATAGEFYYEDELNPENNYQFLQYTEGATYPFANLFNGNAYKYWQHTWGTLHGIDVNISGNIRDRFYWGITLGGDVVQYSKDTEYKEYCSSDDYGIGNYKVSTSQDVTGYGINAKFGMTIRPIEGNPLRVFFAFETPTLYSLKSLSTVKHIIDYSTGNFTNPIEGIYRYTMRTPAKVRMGIGSTIGSHLAFDVDYEYADYGKTHMNKDRIDEDESQIELFGNKSDGVMNLITRNNLKGVHTLRAGIEGRINDHISIRAGYNFVSSAYKNNNTFSQLGESEAFNVSTGTNYMHMGAMNAITLGAGYRWKRFYADMAYKVQNQKADFYAFDETDARIGAKQAGIEPAVEANQPSRVEFVRHQLTASFGIKF